jgi:hypothetical protein
MAPQNSSLNPSKSINEQEFGFWALHESEFTVCRNYEFGREHEFARERAIYERSKGVNQERYTVIYPNLEDLVLKIRRNWKVVNLESTYSKQSPVWVQSVESRLLVLYPEWPNCPYLRIPKAKRLSRLDKVFPELNRSDDLDALVSDIHRNLRKSEKDNGSAKKASLIEQLTRIASLIQPNWQGAKRVRDIAIPSNAEGVPTIYRRDVETAFRAWLLLSFPDLPDYKKRGRATEVARVIDDLNALAVHRLCQGGKKRSEIVDLVLFPGSGCGGSKSYGSVKKLAPPLRRLPERMKQFYLRVLNHLYPLEPH